MILDLQLNSTDNFIQTYFPAIISGIGAAISTYFWTRRKSGKVDLEKKLDKTITDLMDNIKNERENCLNKLDSERKDHQKKIEYYVNLLSQLEKEKDSATIKVSQLEVEVRHLNDKVDELKTMVNTLISIVEDKADKLNSITAVAKTQGKQ